MTYKKFNRSKTDRKIAGICGGLGEYFTIDPVMFRLLFVFLLFFAGGGLLMYLIFWIVTPEEQ